VTASNHVVTGALIATAVTQPALAIPLAFMSHFVLDALPHYGDTNKRSWLNRNFKYILAVDLFLASLFLLGIVILQPASWFLLAFCGALAVSPDILWLPYFLADLRHEELHDTKLAKFLKWIQWGERPWGIYLEVVVLVGLVVTFLQKVS
jgi:hypothetical protein